MTIALRSALPAIEQGNLTIDASNTGVVLNGSRTPPGTTGLVLLSNRNVVKGLQILRFPGHGIEVAGRRNTIGGDRRRGAGPLGEGNVISGNGGKGVLLHGPPSGRNRVVGNYIGLDVGGTKALGNGEEGVHVLGDYNIIGGPDRADRNVVGGNLAQQVHVNAAGTVIRGNYIGTDAAGKVNLSVEGEWSVAIEGSSPNNLLEGNVILGGKSVVIFDPGSSYNRIVGNLIGLDPSGRLALSDAIILVNQPFNQIERNVVNGNVDIGLGATDNVVVGNLLGTDATGRRALGGVGGIRVSGAHNFVGGATVEERNIVAGGRGVELTPGADSNFVACNYIGAGVDGNGLPSHGITLSGASQNVIQGNLLLGVGGGAGIGLSAGANENWLRANRVVDSQNLGIDVLDGQANLITSNSLSDNAQNARDLGRDNRWDDGRFGNFWSDYGGEDADGDGIGDVAYDIPPNGIDHLPLIVPPDLGCL